VSRTWRALPAAALALVLVGLAGCGVSVQEEAQSLPSGALPTVAPSPTRTQTAREDTIFFVSGRGLEGVSEPVSDHSARGVMAALAAGPPIARQADLRTLLLDPLTAESLLTVVSEGPAGKVVLARNDAFTLLSAKDQVLLVGQVVTSMAEVGLKSVVITDPEGVPIPLVLPDGRVLDRPAKAEDYAALVVDPGR
jgi:hypothetical protein